MPWIECILPWADMLPLSLQFIIAMVAYAINERMARRFDYLLEEVRVLREVSAETTGRKRIPFTDAQRRRLAVKGKALTPDDRQLCCQIVRPSTILAWSARKNLWVQLGTHDEDIAKALVENAVGPSRSNESSVRDSHEQIAKRRRKEHASVVDNAEGHQ